MTNTTTTKSLTALRRAYAAAIRAEEGAPTVAAAWRLARKSEAALRELRAAEAGVPFVQKVVLNARAKARLGLAIARAVARKAALVKATAASVVARARRKAAKRARAAMRRVRAALGRILRLPTAPAPTRKPTTAAAIALASSVSSHAPLAVRLVAAILFVALGAL